MTLLGYVNAGNILNKTGSGYTNMCNHIRAVHEHAIFDPQNKATLNGTPNLDAIFYHPSAIQYHGWLSYIIDNLLPFSCVERPTIREHIRSLHQRKYLHVNRGYWNLKDLHEIVTRNRNTE